MSKSLDVVTLIGSLRRGSYSRRLVEGLAALAPPTLRLEILEIGEMPLYNQDLDDAPPAVWANFRARIRRADGVLFATPEYNRSVPGVLKNALDVASRPYGQSAWSKKPCAIVSTSPGVMGGFGANHHLRQSLVFLDMPTLQQPEVYLSGADRLFDASGKFARPETEAFCRSFLATFEQWIRRQLAPSCEAI